jgi:hypothetical protein
LPTSRRLGGLSTSPRQLNSISLLSESPVIIWRIGGRTSRCIRHSTISSAANGVQKLIILDDIILNEGPLIIHCGIGVRGIPRDRICQPIEASTFISNRIGRPAVNQPSGRREPEAASRIHIDEVEGILLWLMDQITLATIILIVRTVHLLRRVGGTFYYAQQFFKFMES